ncbi:MAG: hypothetical protein WDM81_03150 [Rhizomicrobium sp.]
MVSWVPGSPIDCARDHADRLADIDRSAARQIAPIALAAHAVLELAGEHGTDADALDVRLLDPVGDVFRHFLAALDDDVARIRVLDVFRRGAAQDALGQRGHDRAAVDFGLDVDAILVPQSSVVMMQSLATSTRRRVR